jgi:hypothetical protein
MACRARALAAAGSPAKHLLGLNRAVPSPDIGQNQQQSSSPVNDFDIFFVLGGRREGDEQPKSRTVYGKKRALQSLRIIVRREDFSSASPPINLARQKTCKLLLQVKQKFVINLETSSRKRASLTLSSVWREKEGVFGCGCAALRLWASCYRDRASSPG